MKANMKVILFVMSLCFLSGCATFNPPNVLAESKPVQTSSIKPTKVLIVIDTSLEDKKTSGGVFVKKEEAIDRYSGKLGRTLVEKIKAQGINAEYLVHSSPLPYAIPDIGYSHVLVEQMIRITVTDYTSYSDRVWTATLYEYDNNSKKLIFSQSYVSDGIVCVGGAVGAVGDLTECRIKYIEHLLGHLTSIGVTSNQPKTN
jgi:hypothetical protein